MLTAHIEISYSIFNPASGKATQDGPDTWAPVTQEGDKKEASGSIFLFSHISVIWSYMEVNKQMEDSFSFSLSLSLSNFQIDKYFFKRHDPIFLRNTRS